MTRDLPRWFPQAGLGIFVHWGPFAVPAFAPTLAPGASVPELLRSDPRHLGARMPYAEWYRNAMTIPGSATARHHHEVWGDAPYDDFKERFEAGLHDWDPHRWAELFAASGAGYVVLVTKHHDGYCLWPTAVRHPVRSGWCSPRDLVGELAEAVRAVGLRFGVYYSTGLDWSVHHEPIRELVDTPACIPTSPAYVTYVTAQLDELVERYAPSVVWADIGTPKGFDVAAFKNRLLRAVPDAVINDRWDPPLPGIGRPFVRRVLNGAVALSASRGPDRPFLPGRHRLADFRTPEYSLPGPKFDAPWETTRGLGAGFGYNAVETDDLRIAPDELVTLYRQVRAAGGNLLLNVGPRADGTIQDAESQLVRHLGAAIARSGDAARRPPPAENRSAP
jgi:alpha-L-fucosidase